MNRPPIELRRLARLYGVQTAFTDTDKRLQPAAAEALTAVLGSLGVEVHTQQEVEDALADRALALWQEPAPPVVAAWQGEPPAIEVRLPVEQAEWTVAYELRLETGQTHRGTLAPHDAAASQLALVEEETFVKRRFHLPHYPPVGYHELSLEFGGRRQNILILSAPPQTFPWKGDDQKLWGVFLPLYALHRKSSWGAGDLSDLEALMDWAGGMGAGMVATLPMSATFAERSDDPSPYSPASRLFFNEFYLDLTRLPELNSCSDARRILESAETRSSAQELRRDRRLDHLRWMKLKRSVLEPLADCFFQSGGDRSAEYQEFLRRNPLAEEYAAFRATGETLGLDWRQWPEPIRSGKMNPNDAVPAARRYHLYAQFRIDDQLSSLADRASEKSMLWYADLPLGVSSDSFDVWRNQSLFALGASGGAPPDAFFTAGQNWGFPPIHPHRLREQGYRYFIDTLQRQFQTTKLLRLDHIMGLYRLFWIPSGCSGKQGAYVRYPQEELFAVLSIESHRRRAGVVGEDLGTVPKPVRAMMDRCGVSGMYVLPFESSAEEKPALRPPKATAVASLNTHDLPTFASFWEGRDVEERVALGLLTEAEAVEEFASREKLRDAIVAYWRKRKLLNGAATTTLDALRAALAFLATSDASVVLVNLEDLWLEPEPQNTPGTWKERPNWRRRARHPLEDFSNDQEVLALLRLVAAARKRET